MKKDYSKTLGIIRNLIFIIGIVFAIIGYGYKLSADVKNVKKTVEDKVQPAVNENTVAKLVMQKDIEYIKQGMEKLDLKQDKVILLLMDIKRGD